jgi:hypothetical protein
MATSMMFVGENPVAGFAVSAAILPVEESLRQDGMEGHRLLGRLCFAPAYDAINDRACHVQSSSAKIDVTPLESKQLALSQPSRNGQKDQRSLSKREMSQENLDFCGCEYVRGGPPLGTLANEFNGISIEQLIPQRVVKQYRHQVSDFGAAASC